MPRISLCRQYMLAITLLLSPLLSTAETLHLTAVFQPPYAGPNLPEQGALVHIVKKAVSTMGHEVKVDFYGPSRAIKLAAKSGGKYLGYLPAYQYQTQTFVFSRPLATTPIGLLEMKLHPLSWLELDDLQNYTLGVAESSQQIPELSAWLSNNAQPKRVATSDMQNLRNVATARVDGAVMDLHVFSYLMQTTDMVSIQNKLRLNRRLLTETQLFAAFQRTPEGRRWLDIVNQGLAGMDIGAELEAYLNAL